MLILHTWLWCRNTSNFSLHNTAIKLRIINKVLLEWQYDTLIMKWTFTSTKILHYYAKSLQFPSSAFNSILILIGDFINLLILYIFVCIASWCSVNPLFFRNRIIQIIDIYLTDCLCTIVNWWQAFLKPFVSFLRLHRLDSLKWSHSVIDTSMLTSLFLPLVTQNIISGSTLRDSTIFVVSYMKKFKLPILMTAMLMCDQIHIMFLHKLSILAVSILSNWKTSAI